MFENLLESILVEVLVRLPFESIIRFRCVSKSWRDLIDTRYVTDMHHRTRTRRLMNTHPHPDYRIIIRAMVYTAVPTDPGRLRGFQIHTQLCAISPVVNVADQYEVSAYKPLSSPCSKFSDSLVGSCNGILCSYLWLSDDLFLWNPFTSGYCHLPPAPEFSDRARPYESLYVAFGYDHINDDCKIVKYRVSYRQGFRSCVYSLKHKSWSTVTAVIPFEMPPLRNSYSFPRNSSVANGAVHWLIDGCIVAFDLASSGFRKLPSCPSARAMALYSVGGSLLLLCYRLDDGKVGVADFWVMEDYGVSWTKLASVDLRRKFESYNPLMFFEGRRKLLLEVREKLEVYDVETESFSEVAIKREAHQCAACGKEYYRRCACGEEYYVRYYVCVGSFVPYR